MLFECSDENVLVLGIFHIKNLKGENFKEIQEILIFVSVLYL